RGGGARRGGADCRLSETVSSGDDRAEGTDRRWPARHRQPLRERAGIIGRDHDVTGLLAVRSAGGASRRDDRDRRAQSRCIDLSVRQNRRGLLHEPAPGHGAAGRYDHGPARPRERDIGDPLLLARDGAHLPLCGLRHEGLGRACDAGTRIPLYAGYRAAGNRSASRACTRDHRLQGLQRPRSRARRVRCGDQSRTPLPDHRGGSAARRRRVRGDRPFGGGPPAGEGLPMTVIVLYPEERQIPDDGLEAGIFGPDVRIMRRQVKTIADLDPTDCAEVDGLMIMRYAVTPEDIQRFPRLRAIVRMGVGYDRIARPAAAARSILVCNVPDYGTTEVADHAMALALSLRRGVILYHERQRQDPPAPWGPVKGELIRRLGVQTFGIIGLGRIGTAVAL